MKYKNNLLYKLDNYSKDGLVPFHMPGHKRNDIFAPNDAYLIDITEIDDFDDLHHPEDCLKSAMERASDIFGTKETFFLVNGCTGGILAAVSATCNRGDHILLARNSHKSVYNTLMLNGLEATYLWPKGEIMGLPCGMIEAADVEKAFVDNPHIKCVFITSPTYEGVVSDIAGIADIVHRHNAVLIVDEAHGSHMQFGHIFPKSAIAEGADIVIHGIHKTLPTLTQTALLHINSDRVDQAAVKKYLRIFQTSSPSYVLMGAIDYCMDFLENDGKEYYNIYCRRLERVYNKLSSLKALQVLPYSQNRDASKIVISTCGSGIDGLTLYNMLRKDYNLQPEMSLPQYVIMMTSVMDDENALDRLTDAILRIDNINSFDSESANCSMHSSHMYSHIIPGSIAGDMLYVYPPGIPIVVPGETYTEEIIESINHYIDKGYIIKKN